MNSVLIFSTTFFENFFLRNFVYILRSSNSEIAFAYSGLFVLEIMEDFASRALWDNFKMAYHITKSNQSQFSFQVSKKHDNRK